MARPLNRDKELTKKLILQSATKLFLERGYQETRIKDIALESGVGYNEIFRIYDDKDNLLSQLIDLVIECQFSFSKAYLQDITDDNLLIYSFETILQLYIAESHEHLREMYAVSYSLPITSHKIYNIITYKLENVFRKYLPNYQTKEFYELEIAPAGIMRGFIINPCNIYFTMDRKVDRFLKTTLKIYELPKEKIEEIINFVKQFDFKLLSQQVIDSLFDYIVKRT